MKFKKSVICFVLAAFVSLISSGVSFAEDYEAKVKTSMAALKEKLNSLGAPELDGRTLLFGDYEVNGDYEVVDAVTEENGGTATIFVLKKGEFVRISTNVIKDGNRAVGTMLAPDGPVKAKIVAGEAFYGEVDILGSNYYTGYEPIKTAEGDIIGIYYVGYKQQ